MTRRQFLGLAGVCALVPAASQGTRITTGVIPWLRAQKFRAEPASMVTWDEQDWPLVSEMSPVKINLAYNKVIDDLFVRTSCKCR